MGKITRGISKEFAEAFKKCALHELYENNKDELILGVRNNYLNIYYNCDSIAKVKYNRKTKEISCETDRKYIDGESRKQGDKDKVFKGPPKDLVAHYKNLKINSDKKSTNEKKAQSKLYILNNNKDSNWFCIDVEYVKAFKNRAEKAESGFNARFDIIAVSKSKESSYRVALIELKYGSGSIGGKSGIYKHVHDFSQFVEKCYFESHLQEEIIEIIKSQMNLGIQTPFDELPSKNDLLSPEFFFITLDNNKKTDNGSTPKQTMAGYLFKDKHWDCKRLSTTCCVEEKFGDVTKKSNDFFASFLFSEQDLDNLTIDDIIDGDYNEKILPK